MNETAKPVVVPARGAWLVWMVPMLALVVGGYLLVREFGSRGPLVTITFHDGSGLEAGQTKVLSRGVVVGQVESVELTEDLASVRVQARLHKSAQGMARSESKMWISRPEISASGIHGLDTLMRGPHIEIEPGQGERASKFSGLDRPPLDQAGESRRFVLHTPQRGTMKVGVPILFRGMEVGRVESVKLAPDATEIRVGISVNEPYTELVREGTVFWDAGGVDMKVGLLGARLRTGSLSSMLSGAIAMALPPDAAEAPQAESGSHFVLNQDFKDSWLEWSTPMSLPLVEETP